MPLFFDRHGVHRADAQTEAVRHIQHDLDHVHAHVEGKTVAEVAAELHVRLERHGWQFDDALLTQWAEQMIAGDRIVVQGDDSGRSG